jgi:hypothetical protein
MKQLPLLYLHFDVNRDTEAIASKTIAVRERLDKSPDLNRRQCEDYLSVQSNLDVRFSTEATIMADGGKTNL